MSGMSSRLVKGSLWLSVARAIVNILTMLNTIVLAWFLVPADFGIVALATTLMAVAMALTELSLAQALIRHPAPTAAHFNTAWTLNALRGVLLALAFMASAWLVSGIYGDAKLVSIMITLGFCIFLSALENPRRIMLQRELIFRQEFFLNVASKLVTVVVSTFIAWFYHIYWAIVMGMLAGQVTNLIVSYLVVPFVPRPSLRHSREMLDFSLWVSGQRIVDTLNWRADILLLGKFLGITPVGQYTVGNNLAILPTRELTLPLTQAVFPSFSKIKDDIPRLAAAYQRTQALVMTLALPAGVGTAVVAGPLILLLMGDSWAPITFIVQWLAPVFALQTLGSLVQPLAMALDETRLLFWRSVQMFVIRVPIIIAGLWMGGLFGLIVARCITGLIAIGYNVYLVRRLVPVPIFEQFRSNARSLTAVVVMAVGVALAESQIPIDHTKIGLTITVGTLISLGAVLYAGSLCLLWIATGRPSGPESELTAITAKVLRRFRRTHANPTTWA